MAEVLETLQTNIVVETSSDAKMDVDVITDVAVKNLLGEMLSDIEAGNGEQIDKEFQASKSMNSVGSTTSLVSEGKIKLEKEDKMAAADSKRREVQPPDPNGKSEPIVIDLSDDEEEYSKENIEKTPVKSLNGLVKSLTTDKSDELIAKIKMAVSKLPRDVLEDMYCAKICENIELDTSVRKLEQKVLSFNLYKDRMTSKAQGLQGQVVDSARAMGVVTDLLTRNPKNVQKASNPTPLKFQRTVGIQCRNDPLPRLKGPPLTNSKLMNTPPPPLAIPNGNGKKVVSPGITPHKNGVIQPAAAPVTQQTVLKRQKQTISVDDVRDQVQSEVPPKVARRPGPASAMRAYQQAAAANPSDTGVSPLSNGNSVSPNSGSSKALVDLTSQTQNKGNVVVNQNGVQYRVVNSAMPQGVQIVTSTAGAGPYQLVTNGQQGRPILVQQQPVRPMNSGQPLVIRPSPQNSQNIIIRTSGSPTRMSLGQGQRPVISVTNNTRQVSPRGNSPATLNNVVARTQAPPNNGFATYPKFILPELPQMSSQPKKPKDAPPRPTLTLQEQGGGIVLSWTHISSAIYAEIQSYQIFACQEPIMNGPINGKVYPTPQWKRVGDVKALPLPMACTLSQFTEENRYHFIVRGVDVYNRTGLFCEIVNILLKKRK